MVPIYIGNNESSVVLNRVRDRKSYLAGKLVTNVTAFIFVFFFFFFFFFFSGFSSFAVCAPEERKKYCLHEHSRILTSLC